MSGLLRYYATDTGWERYGRPSLNPNPDPAWLEGWGLPVWRDEFDGDTSKWNVRNNFLTMDAARAMASNVEVNDGRMHLLGTWLEVPETGPNLPEGIVTHYTGYVDTRNLADSANPDPVHFSQQWGRWEVRCQTPTGSNTLGALAAFWLRNDPIGGQSYLGEIDILESWGGAEEMPSRETYVNWVYGSGFTSFHNNTNGSGAPPVNGKTYRKAQFRHWQAGVPRTVFAGMHTYVFERMPTYMLLSVDGIQVFRVTPESPDPNNASDTLWWLWDEDFFGSPLHMRMNLHVGPSPLYYGLPDPDRRELTTDPLDFAVEYVRVYAPGGA